MYTIFGGRGFIGGNIVKKLNENKIEFFIPEKNDESIYEKNLGKVIYCAGVTSDFRERPYDTVDAHVNYLSKVLRYSSFESFVYISSTRVYFNSTRGSEDVALSVNPHNLDDIFNVSKLLGESLCLNSGKDNVKVARISNVCGDDFTSNNFIYSIIKDAIEKKEIILNTTLDSEKDYIGIEDVVNMLLRLGHKGNSGIYNVASGKNISNGAIISILKEITKCNVKISESATTIKFPKIEIGKIKSEFNFMPCETDYLIRDLINTYISRKR
ncbi:NAD-dependent epimerase/dehydratase family protein [Clostridium sp. UBA4548]|uniref:NAD-dependent epimerase/dehydratase family protein n=1 Tax=Clostridium sp. UBA4548 TaxID=1946361 RepID=UPI0025BAF6A7|nr:NAD(P)-dependent oxidoreductase [Clostridium sp. UBA4548]